MLEVCCLGDFIIHNPFHFMREYKNDNTNANMAVLWYNVKCYGGILQCVNDTTCIRTDGYNLVGGEA